MQEKVGKILYDTVQDFTLSLMNGLCLHYIIQGNILTSVENDAKKPKANMIYFSFAGVCVGVFIQCAMTSFAYWSSEYTYQQNIHNIANKMKSPNAENIKDKICHKIIPSALLLLCTTICLGIPEEVNVEQCSV